MSVRCNTNSVGVSCPEAPEQTGQRVTQHINRPNPFIFSHTFLLPSARKSHITLVWLQKMGLPNRVPETTCVRKCANFWFSSVFWTDCAFRWSVTFESLYAHKKIRCFNQSQMCTVFYWSLNLHQKSHSSSQRQVIQWITEVNLFSVTATES